MCIICLLKLVSRSHWKKKTVVMFSKMNLRRTGFKQGCCQIYVELLVACSTSLLYDVQSRKLFYAYQWLALLAYLSVFWFRLMSGNFQCSSSWCGSSPACCGLQYKRETPLLHTDLVSDERMEWLYVCQRELYRRLCLQAELPPDGA